MKKTLAYVLTSIVILVTIFVFILTYKKDEVVQNLPAPETQTSIDMCYQYSKETPSGLTDRAWLMMSILGDTVTGEYQNLPAEKDSKVGKFTGTVGSMNPEISGRIADVWWDSFAEGMNVTEQLNIEFGEGSAVALFGEMIDRGDGVYVYKDVTKLYPGFQMSQTDCEALDEKIIVEKYIRENVKTIVPEKPVLGGNWYVTLVHVNPSMKNGTMNYEDGHIQGKKEFNYVITDGRVTVNLISPRACYKYHQVATVTAPYAVDEYVDLTVHGTKVSGTKRGTQSGPDMTNGYTGTLVGTINKDLITVIFSYTIEGSKNKEQELYKLVSTGLQKMRYPLIERAGMLVPDVSKEFKILSYLTVDCSSI